MGALLFPGSSLADAPGDTDDPFFAMEAVEEEELASARGGAVLPNGMTIEVTGLMRVMVDGQHLTTSTFGDLQPGGAGIGGMQPMLDGPTSVINSLNGISLDQYREINFHISNLPTSLDRAPFVPRPDVSQGLRP